uniref:Uncharacterized protein n=1 Tax=Timema bartmani TaxID=61472 RepID=A0A7R9EYI4_9NEOP|nr:unnamed protein product [Timema bartmani]
MTKDHGGVYRARKFRSSSVSSVEECGDTLVELPIEMLEPEQVPGSQRCKVLNYAVVAKKSGVSIVAFFPNIQRLLKYYVFNRTVISSLLLPLAFVLCLAVVLAIHPMAGITMGMAGSVRMRAGSGCSSVFSEL